MRALEKIGAATTEMVKVMTATHNTLVDLGKLLQEFKESDIVLKVDADQLDLELEPGSKVT